MKKLLLLLGFVSFTTTGFVSCSGDNNNDSQGQTSSINASELPSTAKSFVTTYFSDTTIQTDS